MENKQNILVCLLIVVSQLIFAQRVVRGTVSDANGPLPGANVIEQGTSNGVSTDFDGYYEITISGE